MLERQPERWLPLLREAAGAKRSQCIETCEDVRKHNTVLGHVLNDSEDEVLLNIL